MTTAACGFATGFVMLLLCRVLVGVGEGAWGPTAPTLLSDLYPVQRRGAGPASESISSASPMFSRKLRALAAIEPDSLTPREALEALYRLKQTQNESKS